MGGHIKFNHFTRILHICCAVEFLNSHFHSQNIIILSDLQFSGITALRKYQAVKFYQNFRKFY